MILDWLSVFILGYFFVLTLKFVYTPEFLLIVALILLFAKALEEESNNY